MWYHKKKEISASDIQALEVAISNASSSTEVRRLQSILFRANGLKKELIASLLQYSSKHVQRIWSEYFKGGIESLRGKDHGGRRHFHLDTDEERRVLANHERIAGDGKILEIDPLHKELCEKIGKKVALSTAYRIAKKHGWRKITPRPYHPKRKGKSVEYFKVFSSSIL